MIAKLDEPALTEPKVDASISTLSEFASNDSISNSDFHLAAESNQSSSNSLNHSRVASAGKSKPKATSSKTTTSMSSPELDYDLINDDNTVTLKLPKFVYDKNLCRQTGSTSIREEKLTLKNLVLTLFHIQISNMSVAKASSNETESDIRAEAHQEETLGHLICSISLMAIEEMIISPK
jgi:hypothetical protein